MKFHVTWTARSTHIFENAVRLVGTDQYLCQHHKGTKIGSRKSVSHYTVCKSKNFEN